MGMDRAIAGNAKPDDISDGGGIEIYIWEFQSLFSLFY